MSPAIHRRNPSTHRRASTHRSSSASSSRSYMSGILKHVSTTTSTASGLTAATMSEHIEAHPQTESSSPASSVASALVDPHRRRSLLGQALSKSEYNVINLADPDDSPRLVTYVKEAQGFSWNQELFLPAYLDYDYSANEHTPDAVHDIILTDEEAAALLPQ